MSDYSSELDDPTLQMPSVNWDDLAPPDEDDVDTPPPDWNFPLDILREPPQIDPALQLALWNTPAESAPSVLAEPDHAERTATQLGIPFERGQVNPPIDQDAEIQAAQEAHDTLYLSHLLNVHDLAQDTTDYQPSTALHLSDHVPVISLPPEQELLDRAAALHLYDARFIGRDDLDQDGSIAGYTVQALELYADPVTGDTTGRVLDVGHYTSIEDAEQQYFGLQRAVGEALPVYGVAAAGEQMAIANDLFPQWREATPDDLERYTYHLGLDTASLDMPPDDMPVEPLVFTALQTAGIDPEREQQQAIESLRQIGLEPPDDFNLRRDSFLDDETGNRIINGVFQQDLTDDSANCQATFVSLSRGADGFEAEATPFGAVGSFGQAQAYWQTVQTALQQGGPGSALEAMESIQTHLEREGIALNDTAESAPDEWHARGYDTAELAVTTEHGWSRDMEL